MSGKWEWSEREGVIKREYRSELNGREWLRGTDPLLKRSSNAGVTERDVRGEWRSVIWSGYECRRGVGRNEGVAIG